MRQTLGTLTQRVALGGWSIQTPAQTVAFSDDFDAGALGTYGSVFNVRPTNLSLMCSRGTNFWLARNTLIQEGRGPYSAAEVKLNLSHLQPGTAYVDLAAYHANARLYPLRLYRSYHQNAGI